MSRRQRTASGRAALAAAAILNLMLLAACANPNAIGVQDFGYIQGRVLSSRTNQPITGTGGNAPLVASAGYTAIADPNGGFQLHVPVGEQTYSVSAPGYLSYSQQVTVQKDQTTTQIGQNGDGYVYLTPSN
jgi:hypothetical protein